MIFPKRRVRMHLASLKLTSCRMVALKRLYAILENNVSITSVSCAEELSRFSVKHFIKQTQCPFRCQLVRRPHWPLAGKP